jgi:hypothetical protein
MGCWLRIGGGRGSSWSGHASWHISPEPWTSNCCCGMNNLVAENRVLKAQLQGRLRLSDAERARLGEIGHRLGRKALEEVATIPYLTPSWHGTEG